MSRTGSEKQSLKNPKEMTKFNNEASASSPKTPASTKVNQENQDNLKPSNGLSSNDHKIQVKGPKSNISSKEEFASHPLDNETVQKLKSLYTGSSFSASDYNDIDDWIEHDSSKDSAWLADMQAINAESEQRVQNKVSRGEISTSLAEEILQSNQEDTMNRHRKQEELTRWIELINARLAKYYYLEAVKYCEEGRYEKAAEWAEKAMKDRVGNEMVKELKRKITILRIGVLEEDIKELRKAWWEDREE